jgi:hypothetical protein
VSRIARGLNALPWVYVVIACATLGLAPFAPEPHVIEKLRMLFSGTLSQGADIFDLGMHGTPWLLLVAKLTASLIAKA